MTEEKKHLMEACTVLGLTNTRDTLETLLHDAEQNGDTYLDFLAKVMQGEMLYRLRKAKDRRVKEAGFPFPPFPVVV